MEISLNDNNLWQSFTSESIARHWSYSGVINPQPDESCCFFSQAGKEKCLLFYNSFINVYQCLGLNEFG